MFEITDTSIRYKESDIYNQKIQKCDKPPRVCSYAGFGGLFQKKEFCLQQDESKGEMR